jgi:hypothetical protein
VPTYPTPNPSYKIAEAAYVSFLSAIPYMAANSGGTLVAAKEPQDVLDLSRYTPPTMVLCWVEEQPTGLPPSHGGTQETMLFFDLYTIGTNFSLEGGGRLAGEVVGINQATDPGVHAMVDDAVTALFGQSLAAAPGWPSGAPLPKILLGSPVGKLHFIDENRIIYRSRFRNAWIRLSVW